MRYALIFSLVLAWQALANDPMAIHDRAERDYQPRYFDRATGDLSAFKRGAPEPAPWPVELLSIGHTSASYQLYSGSLSDAYFHHGLDIRANAGSPVSAPVGGKVINIENYEPGQAAYWEIAILDKDGFIWQFHHIDHHSIPSAITEAYKNGTPIEAGAKLGEVFFWPIVTFGERYHHIHLNILGKDRSYVSPFLFLKPLADTKAPEFVEVGLLQNGKKVNGNTVSGEYSLFAHVRDLILSDKFYVPPHQIFFQIDREFPVVVWDFDTLPGGSSNSKFVNDFFVPMLTCGSYTCRRPVINLGFTQDGPRPFPSASGPHRALITARDFAGNAASKEFSWNVQ